MFFVVYPLSECYAISIPGQTAGSHAFCSKEDARPLFLQENLFFLNDVAAFNVRFYLKSYFLFASSRCTGVGIVIFRRSLLSRAFYTYDGEGRVTVFHFFLRSNRYNIVNVNAPSHPSATCGILP